MPGSGINDIQELRQLRNNLSAVQEVAAASLQKLDALLGTANEKCRMPGASKAKKPTHKQLVRKYL